ncbi:hypothetical protein [Polaribacter gochangensis]|uniref:hypothetical protein n=1 Tax=Polaribacter gochangensis TaxID=3252903 RepID=UPI003904C26A
MKKIAFALAFIFTVSSGFSQQRKRMAKADTMTPEQRATLSVKKMALQLDLTKDQTKKITALYTEMGKQRKVKGDKMRNDALASRTKLAKIKKESKDRADFKERVGKAIKSGELKKEDATLMRRGRGRAKIDFDTANEALDNRIEFQAKMKKILSPEQYAKFTKLQKRKVGHAKKRMDSKKKMKNKKGKMKKRGKGKR